MEGQKLPIYEYQCSNCGEIFEAFQKLSDAPLTECKLCRGRVEKLISQSSFQLKGSGWYLTDYAKKSSSGSSTEKPKATETTADTAEKPTASTETKVTEAKK